MFHILVVDDDKHTRMLLRAVLENAHYTVTTATNGEEAPEALDKEHIDLVVLDIMMPKIGRRPHPAFRIFCGCALPPVCEAPP